jgi:hypothetical protein
MASEQAMAGHDHASAELLLKLDWPGSLKP